MVVSHVQHCCVRVLGSSADPSTFVCEFWDETTQQWLSDGVVLLSSQLVNNSLVVTCASVHLTVRCVLRTFLPAVAFTAPHHYVQSFAGQLRPQEPSLNLVNPISDASLITKAFNIRNLFPELVILSLLALFVVGWAVSVVYDRRNAAALSALREAHFLAYGQIKSGQGKDSVRTPPPSSWCASARLCCRNRMNDCVRVCSCTFQMRRSLVWPAKKL